MPDDAQIDADRLDETITAVLAGRPGAGVDPTILWLAASARPTPPPNVLQRIQRRIDRAQAARWRPVQLAAAVLATLFFGQGVGDLANSEWISRGLGEPHATHPYVEGGIALIVLAGIVAAGFLDRRALPISVAGGSAVGIAYGINGLGEIGQFAAGVALHMTELAAAVVLLVLWWRARRYGRGDPPEDRA